MAMVPLTTIGRDQQVVEACGRVADTGRAGPDGRWIECGLVRDYVLGYAPGRTDRPSKECLGCHQVARLRQPAIEHLALAVDATIQVVSLASDLDVRLVHQPNGAHRLPVPTDLLGRRRPELLDPAQNGPQYPAAGNSGRPAR